MQSLYSYISKPLIDGHLHAFDHEGCLKHPPLTPYAVGFADIILRKPDKYKNMGDLYKKYIPKCPWVKYWLATGLDIDSIKDVYEKNRDYIRGFGELKLYDKYKGKDIGRKDLRFANQVCSFSEEIGNLPVFVHFNLETDQDVKRFRSFVGRHPNIPIVLCHCGMCEDCQQFAWESTLNLMADHGNLWTDISWMSALWLSGQLLLVTQLPTGRVIWGSDDSPARYRKDADPNETLQYTQEEINKGFELIKYINQDSNIKTLFGA